MVYTVLYPLVLYLYRTSTPTNTVPVYTAYTDLYCTGLYRPIPTYNVPVYTVLYQPILYLSSRSLNKRECRVAMYSGKGDEFVLIYRIGVTG